MSERNAYYVTTPIYYVNDKPHIGHAYTTLACDVLARWKRLDGFQVRFQTGTDEHGQKVEKSARAVGQEPRAFTDAGSATFKRLLEEMNFTADDFIRTTEPRHIRSAQALWRAIAARGDIYLGHYEGWYAVRDEAFYADGEVKDGPGGTKIGPTGAEVEWVKEPSYFFRLSAWADRLLALYAARPDFILPESRRNEVVSFVKAGLRDLSISRTSFSWGIPVPDAPGHVMYVWLDALTNYITAVGYPDQDSDEFRRFWPADLHMIGKDILRFHAVYWPAFLMAAGIEPPRRLFAHGWILNKGEKMSKSLGNVLRPDALIAEFGLDAVRYCLMREVPFGQDGYIGRETMIGRINGDLANDLGNLAQRVLSIVAKNCAGQIPQPAEFAADDRALIEAATALLPTLRHELDRQAFHRALEAVWQVVADANRYVDKQAPWALRKTDAARMGTVLYVVLETVRRVALVLQPFIPEAAGRLLDLLGIASDRRDFSTWREGRALRIGATLPPPQGIFPRFVEAPADAGR